MLSGDHARGIKAIEMMDDWEVNDPERLKHAGFEARDFRDEYKKILGGQTSDRAKKNAYTELMNLAALKYSPIAVADSARRSINNAITGVKFFGNNPVDKDAYRKMNASTMYPGAANSRDGKVVYKAADDLVGLAKSRIPLVSVPMAFAEGAGKEAYQLAENGNPRIEQHKAAVIKGVSNVVANQMPVGGFFVDEATDRYIHDTYKQVKKDQRGR